VQAQLHYICLTGNFVENIFNVWHSQINSMLATISVKQENRLTNICFYRFKRHNAATPWHGLCQSTENLKLSWFFWKLA